MLPSKAHWLLKTVMLERGSEGEQERREEEKLSCFTAGALQRAQGSSYRGICWNDELSATEMEGERDKMRAVVTARWRRRWLRERVRQRREKWLDGKKEKRGCLCLSQIEGLLLSLHTGWPRCSRIRHSPVCIVLCGRHRVSKGVSVGEGHKKLRESINAALWRY